MRLWSLHPKHLDRQGLVAVWREGLLAKAVLEGRTSGYKNHPQLDRFKNCLDPCGAMYYYLAEIYVEAKKRGYNFDATKLNRPKISTVAQMEVTTGQLLYELIHLGNKVLKRSPNELSRLLNLEPHPLFKVVPGAIEPWERVKLEKMK